MLRTVHVVALLLVLFSGCAVADESSECPNWYHRPPGSHYCQCGPALKGGIIICSEDRVYLRVDYAMTWDTSSNQTVAALSNYGYENYSNIINRVYTLMPNHSRNLSGIVCTPNNRDGFLCEDCVPGYGPSIYSPKCKDCRKRSTFSAIALFLALKVSPITVMFILLMIFRINVTQGPIYGYILYCQAHVITVCQIRAFYRLILYELNDFDWVLKAPLFLSAFWVTDLSLLGSDYCISKSLNKMDLLLLNFISVLYPLLLMISMYISIELHARNFRPIVIMWKPFGRCFSKIRRNWSATDSIIHAYATLFLLSFATLNHNALQLLKSTNVYDSTGKVYTNVLVNRPSIHVYSTEYVHYLVIVLTLMFFLGVCPTALLCIYSIKLCRRKLNNCCSQRIQIAFNTFVETFHGTFKDGLNGTRDYRILAAMTLIIAMLCTMLASFADVFSVYVTASYVIFLVLSSFLVAYARPCKSFRTNLSLSFHMMWTAIAGVIFTYWMGNVTIRTSHLVILLACTVPIPHILMISWVVYKLLCNIRCFRRGLVALKTRAASLLLGERVQGIRDSSLLLNR